MFSASMMWSFLTCFQNNLTDIIEMKTEKKSV